MAEKNYEENKRELKFRPTVLVADSSDQFGEDLLDEMRMEGLVMQKCSKQDINYSNAFMVATMKESKDVTKKYYKIQDNVFFRAFATICKNKKFCDKEGCKINDATAAKYVMEQVAVEAKSSYEGMEKICPVYDKNNARQGWRYICPNTKLDEIAFPVKLYDREMGVLIVGQISTPENRKELEACIEEKLKGCTGEESAEAVINKIKIENNLEKLIDKISDTVGDIEEGLKESYEERQNQYVFEKSNKLIENMKKEVNEKANISESLDVYPATEHKGHYTFVGECIKEQLETLCDSIGINKRKIFISTFDNLVNNQYETIRGDDNTSFRYDKWKNNNGNKVICGDLQEYVKGISEELDLLLVAGSATYPIVLAVCSNDFLAGITEEESDLLKWTLGETFRKFTEYAQMAGMEAKSDYYRVYLDSYMSIQRHELGQSNAGYQMLIEEFKRQRNKFLKQIDRLEMDESSYELIEDYIKHSDSFIRDSEGYLSTTMIRIRSTKYLIDFSEMEKTYFYPYDEFLFKWNHIYKVKAEKENLRFLCPVVNNFDYTRPRMYGDPLMIEQAAYNLTNNAIKYAIPGTKVSLDCRVNKEKSQYEITVENIGMPLKDKSEEDKIFQFGRRGSNNKKEGSGLGLFLTRQIAKAHGGDVTCEMKKLSKYNWALVERYIQYYKDKKNIRQLCKNKDIYEELEKELKEKGAEISKYIGKAISDNPFTPMYVNQNILRGTAKFKFTFWIPYRK